MLFVTAYNAVTWHPGAFVEVQDPQGLWLDPDSIVTATPQIDLSEAAKAALASMDQGTPLQAREIRGPQLMAVSLVNGRSMVIEWDLDLQTFLQNRCSRMLEWIRDLQHDERAERSSKGAL